jgi:hypothetical protein
MSDLIETLRLLYWKGSISQKKIKAMSDDGKITYDEFKYITTKEGSE